MIHIFVLLLTFLFGVISHMVRTLLMTNHQATRIFRGLQALEVCVLRALAQDSKVREECACIRDYYKGMFEVDTVKPYRIKFLYNFYNRFNSYKHYLHRITRIGKNFWRPPSPTSLLKQVP